MAVSISTYQETFQSDNIREGFAELVAVKDGDRLYWELPGGIKIYSRSKALQAAKHLNQLISSNLKSEKDLLWS